MRLLLVTRKHQGPSAIRIPGRDHHIVPYPGIVPYLSQESISMKFRHREILNLFNFYQYTQAELLISVNSKNHRARLRVNSVMASVSRRRVVRT